MQVSAWHGADELLLEDIEVELLEEDEIEDEEELELDELLLESDEEAGLLMETAFALEANTSVVEVLETSPNFLRKRWRNVFGSEFMISKIALINLIEKRTQKSIFL